MAKQSLRCLFPCCAIVLGLFVLSCAPAAPAQTPAPAPGQLPRPEPVTPVAPKPTPTKRSMVETVSPQGPLQSSAYRKTLILSELLRRHSDFVRLTPMASKGVPENLTMLMQGQTSFFHANTSNLLDFVGGKGAYQKIGPQPRDRIQNVLSHGVVQAGLMARADSDIYSVKDLKGKKLGVGTPGSSDYVYALRLLGAAGLDMLKDTKLVSASWADNVAAIKEGTIVAWIQSNVPTVGMPYPYVEDVANAINLRFIPVTRELIAGMNKASGGEAFQPTILPAGSYRGQKVDVLWAGEPLFWTADKNLAEDVVHEICRVWFGNFDEALEMSPLASGASPETNKQMIRSDIVVPWHPGALKYYKEVGWI